MPVTTVVSSTADQLRGAALSAVAEIDGWRRSELDPIGAGLRLLARLRLVSDLRPGLRA